jgi:nitrogenase molybdenum-iron protein alpha chain
MATKLVDELREHRPGFTASQGGTECYLRNKSRGGCLKPADRTFAQTTQCQQMNAIATLLSMEDSVFIVHAPDGCSGCASMFNESYKVGQYHRGKRLAKNAHIISSSFDENDVIMGGEKKLRATIHAAVVRYQPKLVFLFASCSSGIIGDDIDSVAAELQKEYENTVLIPIHCEGFKSKIHSTGFDVVFNAIQNFIIGDDRPETEEGLVNIFATTSIGYADQLELERMLKAIGMKVNYIPFFSSYEKLKKIPAAQYSVSVFQVFADTYMKFLSEEYGIPYVITGMPEGFCSRYVLRSAFDSAIRFAFAVGKSTLFSSDSSTPVVAFRYTRTPSTSSSTYPAFGGSFGTVISSYIIKHLPAVFYRHTHLIHFRSEEVFAPFGSSRSKFLVLSSRWFLLPQTM